MRAKRKLIVSMLAIVFVLLAVVATVAITFALTQQTIKTTLNIGYTVEDIDGTASATYTVGGVETPLRAMKNGVDLGNELVFTAADTEDAGNLEFPEDGLALSSSNDNVVIKYTYTNTGDKHFIASMDSETYIDSENMTIEYGIWDFTNEEVKYSEQKYALVVPSEKSLSYWIRISIDNKAKGASFAGDFSWLLSGCDKSELSYELMPSLEFQQTTNDEGNAVAGSYAVSIAAGSTGTYIGEVIFPSSVNNDSVTTIVASSLSDEEKSQVTSVYIPDSVETIDESAFENFTNMETVTLEQNENVGGASAQSGTGLTKIGANAFKNCSKLNILEIPSTVKSCYSTAFTGCLTLKNVTLNSMSAASAIKTLANTNGEMNLTIGNSVTSIGSQAFYGCKGLTSLTIGNNVISIGSYAFNGCTGLTSISIPDSVASIGDVAFAGCTGLTSITVGSGNTTYHSAGNCLIQTTNKTLIQGCNTSVIPNDDSVTSIGSQAFSGCTRLAIIEIPASVTSISSYAFDSCTGLTSLTVASGNTTYHSAGNCLIETAKQTLVKGCNVSVIPTDGSVTIIGVKAFYGCKFTSFNVPNSVVTIEDYAFNNCKQLVNVTLSNNLTELGDYAFERCESLVEITLPDSLQTIRDYAFQNCKGLKSVKIGTGLKSVGTYAFLYCEGLKKVIVSDVSAWATIYFSRMESNPLYYAKNLYLNTDTENPITEAVISGVSKISSHVFVNCESLKKLTIGDGVESIYDSVAENSGLTTLFVSASVKKIEARTFENCKNLKSVTFENTSDWYAKRQYSHMSDTYFTTEELSNTTTAATYLKSTYLYNEWICK